jgi:uncharacterized protein (TIGR02300 family)
MTKPDLGVRRRCLTCKAAFYDMNRAPIICVKCGALFTVVELPHSPVRRPSFQSPAASAAPAADTEGDVAVEDESGDQAGEESTLPPRDDDDEEDDLQEIVTIPNDEKASDS